ncbi:MAG TPA: ATP-binding cassette domain-containing protein [Galbitalea sp.]|jgi:ABC-2 type transport system ATP-binding protein
MINPESVITARGLRKSYRATTVLDGVDLDVGRGEIFAMLGQNGAGKTTTVNILTTLIKPDAGTAAIDGFDVVRDAANARGALSLTGQFAAVDPFQTGAENLAMMANLAHLDRRDARRRITELLARFDLGAAASRRAGTYSGGMRRRLDLAISLLASPPVVFLDEPTTGLDPRSRSQLWSVVRDLATDGTTIFLTTQYLEEADQLADTIAVLNAGRIVATGTASQLKSGLKGDRVELTLDGPTAYRSALEIDFGAGAEFNDERWSVSVPATNPVAVTRDLLTLADGNAIAVRAIDILKPTLDDVFLHLTGAGAPTTTEEVAA